MPIIVDMNVFFSLGTSYRVSWCKKCGIRWYESNLKLKDRHRRQYIKTYPETLLKLYGKQWHEFAQIRGLFFFVFSQIFVLVLFLEVFKFCIKIVSSTAYRVFDSLLIEYVKAAVKYSNMFKIVNEKALYGRFLVSPKKMSSPGFEK